MFGNFYYSTNDSEGLKDFLGVSQVSSPTNVTKWEPRNSFLPMVTTGQRAVFVTKEDTLAGVFSPSFDPRRVVYLPLEAQNPVTAGADNKSRIVSWEFSPHKLRIEVEAEAPALVVVAQASYCAWRAYVDGKSSPMWRANYGFQALAVPTGKHSVKVIYQDKGLIYGAILSAISLLLGICLWVWAPRSGPQAGGKVSAKSARVHLDTAPT